MLTGIYGDVNDIGIGNCILIIIQLLISGIIVLLLDDIFSKGYGIGNGMSLFISTNICESIIWKCFSPTTINIGRGPEFEGIFISFVYSIFTKKNIYRALKDSFTRSQLPNLTNICATVLVFFVVIYFQGFRIDIPIKSKKVRGQTSTYPIKLFYTSNMPIILVTAIISQLFFISQILAGFFKNNYFVKLIGVWSDPSQKQSQPISGLVYYLSPPVSLQDLLRDPVHGITYLFLILSSCSVISYLWIQVSGNGAKDEAKRIIENDYTVMGYRDQGVYLVLNKYISIAAGLGGLCIGILTVFADMLGAIGSGTGILLAVTNIYQFFETLIRENGGEALGILGL